MAFEDLYRTFNPPNIDWNREEDLDFGTMIKRFNRQSDDNMLDIKRRLNRKWMGREKYKQDRKRKNKKVILVQEDTE